jgi:hypothetical protein
VPIVEIMERPSEGGVRLPESTSRERRASPWFPLTLELSYTQSYRRAALKTGSGPFTTASMFIAMR